jgi:hypothetical protein
VYQKKVEQLAERYRIEYVKDYTKFCECCGKEFHVDGIHKNQKYCSPECVRNSKVTRESKILETGERIYKNTYTCELCNKEYTFWNPRYYKRRFCDNCLSQHKSDIFTNKITTTCGYCGKDIEVILSRFYSNKYCYCNVKCMAEHYA